MNKAFHSTRAVVDMGLAIARGEVRGLIGENGSGKSTLASMISGGLEPDSGAMTLLGKPYKPRSSIEGRRAGIAMLVQEASTVNGLTVAENIFLGNYKSVSKNGLCHKRMMNEQARRVLDLINARDIDPTKPIEKYSFEDRKLVEIARALNGNPELLILDETTTALSQKGRDVVYTTIERYRREGKGVLFISHDLDELVRTCDSITVMRDGHFIATLAREEINPAKMRQLMVGRELSGEYYRTDHAPDYRDEVVLRASDIHYADKIDGVSLELHRGEILGIGGLTNCGMHELCKVLFGVVKPDSGEVRVLHSGARISSASAAAANGMGFIPKDREREGLMGSSTVRDNIDLMSYDKLKRLCFITPRRESMLAREQVNKLRIKIASLKQSVVSLSGGNKQKVVIAKWLAGDAQILLMDCPTRGIDVGAKTAIYRLMEEFKREGRSMIMITEELTELLGMSDRILIMREGKLTGSFLRDESLTEHMLIGSMI